MQNGRIAKAASRPGSTDTRRTCLTCHRGVQEALQKKKALTWLASLRAQVAQESPPPRQRPAQHAVEAQHGRGGNVQPHTTPARACHVPGTRPVQSGQQRTLRRGVGIWRLLSPMPLCAQGPRTRGLRLRPWRAHTAAVSKWARFT